jgi:hypothetical protein
MIRITHPHRVGARPSSQARFALLVLIGISAGQ